ncbi:MAG: alpha-galactosidase [Oscillospiraceae bacterium]|nr:alpha-galactosidase [Oscillospiraceae bacterium]
MIKEFYSAKLGDMRIIYNHDSETNLAGLCILPDTDKKMKKRRAGLQSLAEVKIIGDNYPGNYFGGESMKYSKTTLSLRYDRQDIDKDADETRITTYLKSEKGIEIVHILTHKNGRSYVTVETELKNNSGNDIKLEMLSSFTMYNISPYLEGAGENSMLLHRIRGKWSQEGRLVSETLEDLMLEDSWTYSSANSVRFGQVGSMPVKGYFPFMALEDTKNNIIWGVQMKSPASWQMEVTRADDGVCLSGGLADREFGHWIKTVKTGESFKGMEAVISVCEGNVDDVCARLLEAQEDRLNIPECEEELPIIFNEYCTTWGCPSHENISGILKAIDKKGIDYFVIDCGWFKEDGVPWDISMGDYIPSKTLFPNGIDETVKLIKSYNMRPGIWFEIENIGRMANAYNNEEHLLKRDGITLTTRNRRFWDMTDEWVIKYLDERVIDFLKKNDFGYIKVDYNETIGIGCDNSDSLGEGLRQNIEGSTEYFKRMRREIPDLVIENCASGGNRLEPCFMSLSSMASFSDAHECVEIPVIAANLHRVILPRQSQIWCVIRENDSLKRIAYSIAATFLGRMCLSGDVTNLTREQWQTIEHGISFYKKAASVIKSGKSKIVSPKLKSERHPEGYQAVVRENSDAILCVIHTYKNSPEEIRINVGECEIREIYSYKDTEVRIENGVLTLRNDEDFSGYGIILDRR